MIDGVLQCCFTNMPSDADENATEDWRAVACSKDVPKEALNSCERYLLDVSSAQQRMGDKKDDGLGHLAIAGDGRFLYVMRLRYGPLDAHDRRAMFSHAYVFPCTDELLQNPNQFINLSMSNFATSAEEAEEKRDRLARGEELVLDSNLDMHYAIEAAGIQSTKELANLICVAYDSMRKPVRIPCHSECQLRAKLYCIYMLLPLHVRRTLNSISGGAYSDGHANVVFYHGAGRNLGDVLQPDRRKDIRCLGFVDHAALNVHEPGFDPRAYFDGLEAKALSLNMDSASSRPSQVALKYKVAHRLVVCADIRTYSDGLLESSLADALRLESQGSEVLDEHVAAIVGEYVNRGLDLHHKDYYKDLNEKLEKWHATALKTAMATYNAVEKLTRMEKDDNRQFDAYASELRNADGGLEILDIYFERSIRAKGQQKQLSWEFLTTCLTHDYAFRTKAAVKQHAWDLYCSSIKDMSSTLSAFAGYESICRMVESKEKAEALINKARAEFWKHVNLAEIAVDYAETYKTMDDGDQLACATLEILDVLCSVVAEPEDVFLFKFHRYCMQYSPDNLKACIVKTYKGNDYKLADWLSLISMIEDDRTLLRLLLVRALLCRQTMTKEEYSILSDCVYAYKEAAHNECKWTTLKTKSVELFSGILHDSLDRRDVPVPLDVWLRLGEIQFDSEMGGPFRILSYAADKKWVLKQKSKEVVAESGLLKHEKYKELAKKYIERNNSDRKATTAIHAVKNWLKEGKKEASEGKSVHRFVSMYKK